MLGTACAPFRSAIAERKKAVRPIHALLVLLCCTCPASWAEGIDIKKRAPLTHVQAAEKDTELRQSIKAGEYQRAWDACAALLLSRQVWGEQFQDTVFLAHIALADPKVGENGRERLQEGIGLLKQFQERLKASDYAKDPWAMSCFNRDFAEIAYQYGVLGIACGETRTAIELFLTAADFAVNGNFTAIKDKRYRDAYKRWLKATVRYLVTFGKGGKAAELVDRQWEFLGDDAWKVEGAPKTKKFIRACSLLQVANMMEDMGNSPAAARLLLRAYNAFGFDTWPQPTDPKQRHLRRQALLAVLSVKAGDGSLWTSQPIAKYEDRKLLKRTFQQLADQLAQAWVKQDVEAALRVVKDPAAHRDEVTEAFRRAPRFRSLKWTIKPLSPVKTTDPWVTTRAGVTALLHGGERKTGRVPLVFVRDGRAWKIRWLFGDEE